MCRDSGRLCRDSREKCTVFCQDGDGDEGGDDGDAGGGAVQVAGDGAREGGAGLAAYALPRIKRSCTPMRLSSPTWVHSIPNATIDVVRREYLQPLRRQLSCLHWGASTTPWKSCVSRLYTGAFSEWVYTETLIGLAIDSHLLECTWRRMVEDLAPWEYES